MANLLGLMFALALALVPSLASATPTYQWHSSQDAGIYTSPQAACDAWAAAASADPGSVAAGAHYTCDSTALTESGLAGSMSIIAHYSGLTAFYTGSFYASASCPAAGTSLGRYTYPYAGTGVNNICIEGCTASINVDVATPVNGVNMSFGMATALGASCATNTDGAGPAPGTGTGGGTGGDGSGTGGGTGGAGSGGTGTGSGGTGAGTGGSAGTGGGSGNNSGGTGTGTGTGPGDGGTSTGNGGAGAGAPGTGTGTGNGTGGTGTGDGGTGVGGGGAGSGGGSSGGGGSGSCPAGSSKVGGICVADAPADSGGKCPAGYSKNGSLCVQNAGGTCPVGTTKLGTACVADAPSNGLCPTGYTKTGALCVQDGAGDDEQTSFGGVCGTVPTCSGDAVQCAQARYVFEAACSLKRPSKTDELDAYGAALAMPQGDQTKDLAGNSSVTIGVNSFNNTELLGGAGGMQDRTITVMNQSITMPFSSVNVWLQRFGMVLQAVTFLLCMRIVFRG